MTANVVKIRARTRSTIMAVVKADGYGHGAVMVGAAVAAGAGRLGTTSVAEASALRAEWRRQRSPRSSSRRMWCRCHRARDPRARDLSV
ncbi:MAG TPA: alanine racemase [Actinomycetes bacterium]|nr:alanine racemase [Actinomycetes bacterium]